ncbi:Putative acetyltransferase [Sinomonas atrocyanea]|uniref:Putative acetyltransferase n=2 Tax=Sinomonas atrocyanea TaxID=37927 RepID=A0A126ZWI4_9MICC|nr:Putative acetyltransferase [Sinomonas atrocyanea]
MRNWFYENTLPGRVRDLCVFPDTILHYPQNIYLGNRVFMNRGVIITAPAPVQIGDDVLIGPYTVINSANHSFSDSGRPIRDQGHDFGPVVIGHDVWLGARVTVVAGVTIGDGAIVGAGSVVTRDIEPFTVVAGVPARFLHPRDLGAARPDLGQP